MKARVCELCREEASLYCASDAAFLCLDCDARVHSANFLVARHLRQPLCSKCNQISGDLALLLRPVCSSCLPESSSGVNDDTLSSSCVSSTESCTTATTTTKEKKKKKKIGCKESRKRDCVSRTVTEVSGGEVPNTPARLSASAKAEGILVIWCGKLGVNVNLVVPLATRALGLCLSRWAVLPFRVSVAASLWTGIRFCGDKSLSTWQNLRRLEDVSGVPGKLILAAEAKLARAVMARRRARPVLEEGWAESQSSV